MRKANDSSDGLPQEPVWSKLQKRLIGWRPTFMARAKAKHNPDPVNITPAKSCAWRYFGGSTWSSEPAIGGPSNTPNEETKLAIQRRKFISDASSVNMDTSIGTEDNRDPVKNPYRITKVTKLPCCEIETHTKIRAAAMMVRGMNKLNAPIRWVNNIDKRRPAIPPDLDRHVV